ncbi:hypothetical protein B0T11DRAFT_285275 [Plectosphaerella cucumerina]|uniref:Uncharacterized protein n=1 Tax=Plectosphaerella cucumerina TaxID=40658 RepID=A0A8K0X2V7_9PEZI|nr:hypothetical protein B0T11DRAFT_285275 [Plectosphaerella cucumerina]
MPTLSQVQHRLLDIELASKFEVQSPLLRNLARLPSEVIEHIILFVLLQEQCVLRFFAGGIFCTDADAGLTPLQAQLSAIYDLRRVDVHRMPGLRGVGGTHEVLDSAPHMSGMFRTVPNNKIVRWSPGVRDMLMYFPRHFAQAARSARLAMTYFYDNNRTGSLSMNDPFFTSAAAGTIPERPLFIDPRAVEDLPFSPGLFAQSTPPAPDRTAGIRNLVLGNRTGRADPLNIRFMDFGVRGAVPGVATTRKERFRTRILREQSAWLDIDWAVMRRLKRLFIDLSWVVRVAGSNDTVREGAARMCEHLDLELLVIYGLRSSPERWFGAQSRTERVLGRHSGLERPVFDVGQWAADEVLSIAGEEHINWVRVFGGAVAACGRLVLLDDRLEGVDWAALEALAVEEKRILGGEGRRSEG